MKKLLKDAKKTIAKQRDTITDLKADKDELSKELEERKSTREGIRISQLDQENKKLRKELHRHEEVIALNHLRVYFVKNRERASEETYER